MFEYIIQNKLYVGGILEFLAASCGTYYLFQQRETPKRFRLFVYFLWFVFIVDQSGFYALWNYFDDYQTFPWLKDSVFVRNEWLYNFVKPITYLAYCSVIISSFISKKLRKWFWRALALYAFIALGVIIFSDKLFTEYLIPNILLGTLLLLICVGAYFFRLLQTDEILYFSKNLIFYIALGTVVWNLGVTPVYIYNTYFNWENENFLLLYSLILRICNIFMYCTFALGFIVCARAKAKDVQFAKV